MLEDQNEENGFEAPKSECEDMLCMKPRKELTEDELQTRIHILLLIKRALYSLITIILAVLLVVQVVQCVMKYIDEPTYMSSKIVRQYEGDFPSITICPWKPYYKIDVLQDKYNLSDPSYFNTITNEDKNLFWQDEYGEEILDYISYNLDDLISEVKIRTLRASNNSISMMINPKMTELKYKEKLHRKFGKCYSLNLSYLSGDRGIYYAKIKMRRNIKFYIHTDEQFLDLSGRMGYEIRMGETTKFQVNYEIFNTIPGVKNSGNCSYDSYDNCMYNSMKNIMLKEYGCIAPWIPHKDKQDKTCHTPSDKRGVYRIIYNRLNDCLSPCHYMIVNAGGKTVIPSNQGTYVYLYFAHRIPLVQEHYLYDLLTLLAEIGGYCGLFLGYSAFHIAVFLGKIINSGIKDYEKWHRKNTTVKRSIKI